ncbi:MAG: DNA polymerase/3'-5' exonuclease PolX [Spirochaetaceae bacterium]
MKTRNRDIVSILNEVADLLDIQGANAFRVRSYRNAARTVEDLDREVSDLIESGKDLSELPDIGQSIADKLTEIVETGRLQQLDELKEEMDEDVTELLRIENLGPARAGTLYRELGISDAQGVLEAAEAGRIAELDGFGEKTQEQLAEDARRYVESGTRDRILLGETDAVVEPLLEYLTNRKSIDRAVAAGSYRRRKETIGDLDIVAVCEDPDRAMEDFVAYDRVEKVVSQGSTKSTVVLASGLQVDLRAVAEESFGSALYYFTGSKEHNIATRRLAQERGLKINEYGVHEGDKQIAGKTEEEVFGTIDLPYIPPELRENRGEIEAAQKNELPDLLEFEDIRGDIHMHTTATDGKASIEEMAEAAKALGYDYLAITDHSQRVRMAGGLDPDGVEEQLERIAAAGEKVDGIRILSGIEVDILEDGSLDLPDDVLEKLDVVIGSIHYNRNLSEKKMTERLVKAIEHPLLGIVGHPTGRMIGKREPYAFDFEEVFKAAARHGVVMEINANPERLDLGDTAARAAKENGVAVSVSSDAHSPGGLRNMSYGVDTARRGWIEARDVVNTRSAKDLLKALRKK